MKVGDVFSVPLRAGGFGAAIVIDVAGGLQFVVVNGFWSEQPTAAHLRELTEMPLPFGQKALPGSPTVFKGWFDGDVPSDFKVLLNRALTQAQRKLDGAEGTMVFQNARHFARTLSDQWRWENDHAAYMQELEQRSDAFEKRRAQRKASLSLESMLNERFFEAWSGRWPEEYLAEARRIFSDATAKLAALRAEGTPRKRAAVFQRLVKEFNRLDNETGLVESVERDDIVERISDLAALVGLDNASEKLTRRRTW